MSPTPHIEARPGSRLTRRIVGASAMVAAALTGAALAPATAQAAPVTAAVAGYRPATMALGSNARMLSAYGNVIDPRSAARPLMIAYRINGVVRARTWSAPTAAGHYGYAWILPYGTYTVQVVIEDGRTNPVIRTATGTLTDPAVHNPRGIVGATQSGGAVHLFGLAYDPDTPWRGLPVWIYDNGRHIASTNSTAAHNFAINIRLGVGRHLIQALVPNTRVGTRAWVQITARWVTVAAAIPTWQAAYTGNQRIAASLLAAYGWGPEQMAPLISLWNRESGWNQLAGNASGAYGIPQALPGSKMASAGADWATNPATQIKWGFGYIKGRYGTPAAAWANSQATGWY